MDGEVADLDSRKAAAKTRPMRAAIAGEEKTEFRSREQEIAIDRILDHDVHRAALGEVAADHRPGAPEVRALRDVWGVVARLVRSNDA